MTREQIFLTQVEEDLRSCGYSEDEVAARMEEWREALLHSSDSKGTEE